MSKKSPKKSPKKAVPKSKKAPPRSDPPSMTAVSLVRAWLSDSDFREDPTGEDPERIQILGPGYEGVSQEHYVDVRVYVADATIQTEIASLS
jgi:hypothetical protein